MTTADRPTTEPRTAAGRFLDSAPRLLNRNERREAILAIEAEAAQGAAPLTADHNHNGGANCFSDCPAYTWHVRNSHGELVTMPVELAAPRAEGHTVRYVDAGRDEPPENGFWRCSCGKSFAPDGVDEYASHLAAPRAEGLDVDVLANVLRTEGDRRPDEAFGAYAERILARLSRPSDERVPESEERA